MDGMTMIAASDARTAEAPLDHPIQPAAADLSREFGALLDRRDVHMVFQPLVDLRSGEIVALEALARGPESTPFASPLALFAAARLAGRVAELDWVCRAVAFRTFLEADLPPAMSLFVNVEPEAIAAECPPDLLHFVTRAESILRVFVEVNDRAVAADPAGVLAAVDRAREMGWGIAIDDVGSSRAPLAMLPIVQADVVKLDLRQIRDASLVDSSAIITCVLRHVEATGAALLVEGIESEADARWARALGASYGQGHHLGVPGPLRSEYAAPRAPVRLITIAAAVPDIETPFDLLVDLPHQQMGLTDLEELARLLAYSPRSAGAWPVFLTGASRDGHVPPEMAERGLPEAVLLAVMFGTGLPPEPIPGMHGVRLHLDDPLADERFHIVLSDQAPVAIFARSIPGDLYDVVVTQDAELVLEIAHHLIRRIPGPGRDNTALRLSPRPVKASAEDAVGVEQPAHAGRHGWRRRRGGH